MFHDDSYSKNQFWTWLVQLAPYWNAHIHHVDLSLCHVNIV